MKVQIKVTDDQGATFEGSVDLVRVSAPGKALKHVAKPQAATKLSFSLNLVAFMKKYGKSMSGPRKLTLLVARLVEGKPGQEISSETIVSSWDRMKSVLGGAFNSAYANRAKANGWIDAPKHGHYALSPTWQEILGVE